METAEISSENPEFTEYVAQGVDALQAGARTVARSLFAKAIRQDPGNATAWLWLSRSVDDERQKQECLERVRYLDRSRTCSLQPEQKRSASMTLSTPHSGLGHQGQTAPDTIDLGRSAPVSKIHTPTAADRETPHAYRDLVDNKLDALFSSVEIPPAQSLSSIDQETVSEQNEHVPIKEATQRDGRMQEQRRRPIKMGRRWGIVATVVTAAVALLAIVALPRIGLPVTAQTKENGIFDPLSLEASGMIQGEEILLSSEYGGTISAILVEEGQAVSAGQLLVQFDTGLLDEQIDAARAAVALAEAGLALARAGARPGQISTAEAQLAQAQAAQIAAMQAVSDTMALVENPQEIRMQIAVVQAQIEAEKHRLAERLALKDAAEIGKDLFEDAQDKIMDAGGPGVHRVPIPGIPGAFYEYTVPSLPLEAHLAPNYWWQAWVGVNATAAQKEGLEASLSQLYAQQQNPQMLEAQAAQALSALAQAEAQVVIAQAQVDALRAGASVEQISALEARVEQAGAVLDSLLSQRDQMEIRAPIDAIVVDLPVHEGEVAARGASVVTIADLTQVKLTVYVPEPRIGHVHLGQAVQVTVDSFPDRVFRGEVMHIADVAEFTPRNVATQEERVNLVFAVEIGLTNKDGALKPGMPADAVFEQEQS